MLITSRRDYIYKSNWVLAGNTYSWTSISDAAWKTSIYYLIMDGSSICEASLHRCSEEFNISVVCHYSLKYTTQCKADRLQEHKYVVWKLKKQVPVSQGKKRKKRTEQNQIPSKGRPSNKNVELAFSWEFLYCGCQFLMQDAVWSPNQ